MKINKLNISQFGKLKNQKIELSSGFNIIYGENEAGKSTFQCFIKGVLFGLKGDKFDKNNLKKYTPANIDEYKGSIEYSLEDGSKYTAERNFADNNANIFDLKFNNISNKFPITKESGPQFAQEHLGIPKSCFERTVLINQMETRFGTDGSSELLSRLSNISQSGTQEVSYNNAIEALNKALSESVGTGRTTTKPINIVNNRIVELENKKIDFINIRESMADTIKKLEEAKTEQNKSETKKLLNEKSKEIVLHMVEKDKIQHQKNELTEMLERIQKKEQEISTVEKMISEFEKNKKSLENFSEYNEKEIQIVNFEFQDVDRMKKENEELEAEMLTVETNDDKSKITKRKRMTIISIIFIVAALIMFDGYLFSGIQGIMNNVVFLSGGIVLSIVGISLFVYKIIKIPGKSENENKSKIIKEINKEKIHENLQKIEEAKRKIVERLIKTKIIINIEDEIKQEYIDIFTENVRLSKELDPQINANTEKITDLRNEVNDIYINVKDKYEKNCSNVEQFNSWISEIEKNIKLKSDNISNLIIEYNENQKMAKIIYIDFNEKLNLTSQEIFDLEKTINQDYLRETDIIADIKANIRQYETELKSIDDENGDLQNIEEELSELYSKKGNLETTALSIQKALDVITETGKEIQNIFAPELTEKMSEYISKITQDRYSDLRADDNLNLKVKIPDTGNIGDSNMLSGGSVDQVYLALRIAMADMISKPDEPLPLIMDEIFAQYDDIRTEKTIELLMDLSNERQIILLTCKNREVEIAKKVCKEKVNIIKLSV